MLRTVRIADAGYIVYRLAPGSCVEIVDLLVTGERRRGTGTKLLNMVFAEVGDLADIAYVMTRYSNKIAQEFYVANGFVLAACIPAMYDGVGIERTCLILTKELAP